MSAYPEHDKLTKIKDQSQAIGEFMDWLADDGIFLAHYEEGYNFPHHVHTPITDLLASFFGIDQKKLEEEKRQMLEGIRQANATA